MSTNQEWVSCILGKPWERSTPKGLEDLALEYVTRTEEYDRSVCTGPIRNGSIMPNGGREYRLVAENAVAVFADVKARAEVNGWNWKMLRDAIRDVRINNGGAR